MTAELRPLIKMRTVLTFFILILFSACRHRDTPAEETPVKKSIADIRIDQLDLDIVRLDSVGTSYIGYINVRGNQIQFIDKQFATIFEFDTNGKYIKRYMGQGGGPREIPSGGIQFFTNSPDNGFFFIGPSMDCHVVDSSYNRKKTFYITMESKKSADVLSKEPDPDEQLSYNIGYNGQIRLRDGYIYFPLNSMPPMSSKFNLTTDLYAEEARILAKMNAATGKVEKIEGRLSPLFKMDKRVRLFSFINFDIDSNKDFAVSYWPDSLIYIYDSDFRLRRIFGLSGKNMNTAYKEMPVSQDDRVIKKFWRQEQSEKGLYTALEYIDERNLLFRSYSRGSASDSDGLQIYRSDTLIADVNVPKSFKVIGYISPYFYSEGVIDEEKEKISIYRFKIKE